MNLLSSKDTNAKSLSEAFANTFGGFPISYFIGIIILPISAEWMKQDPFVMTFLITCVYALASFVRSFFLRRIFSKLGFDDSVNSLLSKIFRKLSLNNDPKKIEGKKSGVEKICN